MVAAEPRSRTLVAQGKGILAADETVSTLAAEFIRGVIMYDETIRQKGSRGAPLAEALLAQGILPRIKVDTGEAPLLAALTQPSPRDWMGCETV